MAQLQVKWRKPFEWLTQQWTNDETSWADLQEGFLTRLGLNSESDDPDVAALFERIEENLPSAEDRRRALTDNDVRAGLFPELYADSEEKIEPYWDGEQWLEWNKEADEWQPMTADDVEAASDNAKIEPYWDGEQWLEWNNNEREWLPMRPA